VFFRVIAIDLALILESLVALFIFSHEVALNSLPDLSFIDPIELKGDAVENVEEGIHNILVESWQLELILLWIVLDCIVHFPGDVAPTLLINGLVFRITIGFKRRMVELNDHIHMN